MQNLRKTTVFISKRAIHWDIFIMARAAKETAAYNSRYEQDTLSITLRARPLWLRVHAKRIQFHSVIIGPDKSRSSLVE